jgi:putative tricarboxylic transport membrane protein
VSSAHNGSSHPADPGGHAAAGAPPAEEPEAPGTLHELEEVLHHIEEEDRPPHAGPLANVLVALAVIALGAAALIGSWRLGVGSPAAPQAGMWPFLISVVLLLLGLALLPLARRTADAERFTRTSWLVLAGLATMVVFAVVIPYIGFEIPAALLTFAWLRVLGREGWRLSVIASLAVVIAFYLIFVAALSVPIPHLF